MTAAERAAKIVDEYARFWFPYVTAAGFNDRVYCPEKLTEYITDAIEVAVREERDRAVQILERLRPHKDDPNSHGGLCTDPELCDRLDEAGDAIKAAVVEERERCLRIAQGPIDSFYDYYPPEWLRGMRETAEGIIKKIGEAQPDFIDKMVAKKIRDAVADALRSHRCPNCGMTQAELETPTHPLSDRMQDLVDQTLAELGKHKLPDPDVMIGGEG